MALLSNYPFLDQQEFRQICEAFVASFHERDAQQKCWGGLQLNAVGDISFIRIVKSLRPPASPSLGRVKPPSKTLESASERHQAPEEIFEEIDEEALPRQMNSDSKRVVFEIEYEVLLSPSYYIPVLYFSVRDSSGQMVTEIEQIYALIVPAIYRSQMQSIGVMGGLSMANHPVTGIPTFFIHPCQTADALREVAGGRNVSHQEYILLWLGIVGGSVGLNAPLFLGTQQA